MIETVPAAVLLQIAAPVAKIDAKIERLCGYMIATLHEASGLGLAAPQIGQSIRLFITNLHQDKMRVFINPRILSYSPDRVSIEEGCLSIPGVYAEVERPRAIQVEALDVRGQRFALMAEDMLARVIQHEHDHLQGVLFWDKFSRNRRARLQKQYESMRKKKSR